MRISSSHVAHIAVRKRLRLDPPLPPAPVKIDLKINRKSPQKQTSTFRKNEATLGPNWVLKSSQNQEKLQQMPPRTPPKKKSEKQLEKESFPSPHRDLKNQQIHWRAQQKPRVPSVWCFLILSAFGTPFCLPFRPLLGLQAHSGPQKTESQKTQKA